MSILRDSATPASFVLTMPLATSADTFIPVRDRIADVTLAWPTHTLVAMPLPSSRRRPAFTLAELLVACALRGGAARRSRPPRVAVARLTGERRARAAPRCAGRRAWRPARRGVRCAHAARGRRRDLASGGASRSAAGASRWLTACSSGWRAARRFAPARSSPRSGARSRSLTAPRRSLAELSRDRAARHSRQRHARRRHPPGAILSREARAIESRRDGAPGGVRARERAARPHAARRRSVCHRALGQWSSGRLLGPERICTIAARAARSPSRRSASSSGAPHHTGSARSRRRGTRCSCSTVGLHARRPWRRHVLTAAPSSAGTCPVSSGFTPRLPSRRPRSRSHSARRSTPPSSRAPSVRIVRRARYELYRASDSRWYLGYLDCLATRATPCNVVQPVSGPFAIGGIQLSYLGANGAPAVDRWHVARIDLVAVAERRVTPDTLDSLATTIALRN